MPLPLRCSFTLIICAVALVAMTGTQAHAKKPAADMRVAVLEFANTSSSDGLDALGKGLQSMLTTDLAKVSAIKLIERARLADIRSEIKLGQSRLIDRKTAAKIGKLLGATHLLAGTFTVHGDAMRIDARMFSVRTAEILLAEEMTGEKEAFFELEKSLIRKLVRALGLKLAPKERAGIARIHTADFEAFRKFSQGVAHFDEQRYQDAVDALREATKRDAEFQLARVTLGEYEQLIAKIRARADRLETARAELELLKEDKEFRAKAEVVERLFDIADSRGKKTQARRLVALNYLLGMHDIKLRNDGRVSRFQDRYDRFVMRRRAGVLARRYLAESTGLFPKVPLLPDSRQPPDDLKDLDKRIDGMVRSITGDADRSEQDRQRRLEKNLTRVPRVLQHLVVDGREAMRIWRMTLDRMGEVKADARYQREALEEMASLHLALGEIDASSAMLARMSALSDSPRDLKRIAGMVEDNGKLAKWIDKVRLKREAVEYLLFGDQSVSSSEQALFNEARPSGKLLRMLREVREVKDWLLYHENPVIFNREPAFVIAGEDQLLTGPLVGPRRSKELRYYWAAKPDRRGNIKPVPDALVAVGAVPRSDFEARFVADFRIAKDWWPRVAPWRAESHADLELNRGRPEFALVLGLRDIDRARGRDPKTGNYTYPHPTHGLMIRVTERAVQLVSIRDAGAYSKREKPLATRVLAERKLDRAVRGARKLEMTVRVRKGKAQVQIGDGRTVRFKLPKEYSGFPGFHIRGGGYLAIRGLRVRSLD